MSEFFVKRSKKHDRSIFFPLVTVSIHPYYLEVTKMSYFNKQTINGTFLRDKEARATTLGLISRFRECLYARK